MKKKLKAFEKIENWFTRNKWGHAGMIMAGTGLSIHTIKRFITANKDNIDTDIIDGKTTYYSS